MVLFDGKYISFFLIHLYTYTVKIVKLSRTAYTHGTRKVSENRCIRCMCISICQSATQTLYLGLVEPVAEALLWEGALLLFFLSMLRSYTKKRANASFRATF